MVRHIDLNNDWRYSSRFEKKMTKAEYDENNMAAVRLPHTNIELPYHYFNEQLYQFVSCYRKHLEVPLEWRGKQVLLTFEGVAHIAEVYINGERISIHKGGYTAFTVDLSPCLYYGKENVLAVAVDSRETNNMPPFGYVIDYLTYGGIYREAYLDIKEELFIEDAYIITRAAKGDSYQELSRELGRDGSWELELQVSLSRGKTERRLLLRQSITDHEGRAVFSREDAVSEQSITIKTVVEGIRNWEPEEPCFYFMKLELAKPGKDGEAPLDEKTIRFGFRTCEFREDGFYLNWKKRKLIGINRHQSYPYVGYAMPKRMQRQDADILKYELGVNAVRTSHYPQSRHFLDRCDELGLLVFTEIPGWQHIGDEEWKESACEQVREMVLQYRNHPSIVLWGVRINESPDDDSFYSKTNQIAHSLDPARQTSGVRFLKKSSLLEDVYAYNDFLYNGRTKGIDRKEEVSPKKNAPYIISEYNGHMFPAKAFDAEEHRLEHALRHAFVLNAILGQSGVAGGFGWCMFDYNTHKDFGSGDRICYHGVMDMFRNAKLAAAVYTSQSDCKAVLEISSSLDIGEHPAGNTGDIFAFTNADSVRLYKNDVFIREFFPDRGKYPNLPHPPVLIDDFVGESLEQQEHYSHKTAEGLKEVLTAVKKYGQYNLPLRYKMKMAYLMLKERIDLNEGMRLYYKYIGSWGGAATAFRFEAVRNNQVVRTVSRKPAHNPRLSASCECTTLTEEETYDVAEVRLSVLDEDGNRLPYYQEPVSLKAWGAVELIGPDVISLKGGAGGVYVKSKGIEGEGGLILCQTELGRSELRFRVLKGEGI